MLCGERLKRVIERFVKEPYFQHIFLGRDLNHINKKENSCPESNLWNECIFSIFFCAPLWENHIKVYIFGNCISFLIEWWNENRIKTFCLNLDDFSKRNLKWNFVEFSLWHIVFNITSWENRIKVYIFRNCIHFMIKWWNQYWNTLDGRIYVLRNR